MFQPCHTFTVTVKEKVIIFVCNRRGFRRCLCCKYLLPVSFDIYRKISQYIYRKISKGIIINRENNILSLYEEFSLSIQLKLEYRKSCFAISFMHVCWLNPPIIFSLFIFAIAKQHICCHVKTFLSKCTFINKAKQDEYAIVTINNELE